ncbi:MAG TPA: 2-oxoacid:acceptor oxidoreductase family protein [bacterium]|nr:2-oxoacid:acceptor oxidoreductase family protein [bacterium]HPS29721.1 2-oxoacid:acceptor oxidoreductase family protein [bacterium]
MSDFEKLVDSKAGSRFILQGNAAFALGVVHAGYHAADGYPGTPSTEVIDKSLKHVQDRMTVGWSVNEAVATAVAIGHSVAGMDSLVTMKIPGMFQAGDTITTSAFYTAQSGAFVIYAATDYVPSSTQHVIDARYFLSAARIPVFEPRNHQEMYDIAFIAADYSRKFKTPVCILPSGILAHSEGIVTTKEARKIEPRPLPKNLSEWMLMPGIARNKYNEATTKRIPELLEFAESSDVIITETKGRNDWGVIIVGESDIIVKEALLTINADPSIMSMSLANPVPVNRIRKFASNIKKLFVFEDGDRFLQDKISAEGIKVIGKETNSTITDWTPDSVINILKGHLDIKHEVKTVKIETKPLNRPPSICPGCPYRAYGLAAEKLKKTGKLYAGFGEIGCSTLLFFNKGIDTVLCMGGSDSMRQGFCLSRPEMASKVVSVIGDSCECHSGLDATRNGVFRNVPGVQIVLDNRITAMTGGQPAPTSEANLAGVPNKFNLKKAIAAEECKVVAVNAYDLKGVEKALTEALDEAEKGQFTNLVLEGPCQQIMDRKSMKRTIEFDREKCKKCGRCNMCPGIKFDSDGVPHYTNLCINCGGNTQVCMQRCPFGAIVPIKQSESAKNEKIELPAPKKIGKASVKKEDLPESLRIAIRGIGGQGNLFFGKVLSEVALRTPYSETQIVKGDTHGMAQLGGSVISTFACGKAYSPILSPGSADILVVMETSEVLREGFLELLKPGGMIVLNRFEAVPPTAKQEDYPKIEEIRKVLENYKVIEFDALEVVGKVGDKVGKTANVAVLGLLSTIEPFNKIPAEIWLEALMTLSPTDTIKSANQISFEAGRRK